MWLIPAADPAAIENYPKTLTYPVAPGLLATLALNVEAPVYAWGFPRGSKNLGYLRSLAPGDVCLIYGKQNGPGAYLWAAEVSAVVPETQAEEISELFWGSEDFLPYLLKTPVPIQVTPKQLGNSLDPGPQGKYKSHPLGTIRLDWSHAASSVVLAHGNLIGWLTSLLHNYSLSTPLAAPLGPLQLSTGLLKLAATKKAKTNGRAGSYRYSKNAKAHGDLGEQAVMAFLARTLSPTERTTLNWVASKGLTPGWDIDYVDDALGLTAVEVKATIGGSFSCFDLTRNELDQANQLRGQYHLYLVTYCTSASQIQIERIIDPAHVLRDRITPVVFRVI